MQAQTHHLKGLEQLNISLGFTADYTWTVVSSMGLRLADDLFAYPGNEPRARRKSHDRSHHD
jgi:hypothetical protein